MISIGISVQVLQRLLQQSAVTARRIQVVRAYGLAILRNNVPDQVLPCEDATENERKIFHI